jgi:hypothetical protein
MLYNVHSCENTNVATVDLLVWPPERGSECEGLNVPQFKKGFSKKKLCFSPKLRCFSLLPSFYFPSTSYICLSMTTRSEGTMVVRATRMWLNHSLTSTVLYHAVYFLRCTVRTNGSSVSFLLITNYLIWQDQNSCSLFHPLQHLKTTNNSHAKSFTIAGKWGLLCDERRSLPRGYVHTVMSWRFSTPIMMVMTHLQHVGPWK